MVHLPLSFLPSLPSADAQCVYDRRHWCRALASFYSPSLSSSHRIPFIKSILFLAILSKCFPKLFVLLCWDFISLRWPLKLRLTMAFNNSPISNPVIVRLLSPRQ
ncbi:hypothetical protein ARMSODRAFT_783548 [Armillaria solidipes]|uniref:Uncharacterized protein n=1 Tax=Armillaria solidipes TaxID=1076256 RepID=A0A2H3BRR8_9AGAR|nr:hypothetical protein ARMSODRAFT_783548 [Armillaria solidipes]